MKKRGLNKGITVLSSSAPRQWYSPFSKILREMHQEKIVYECVERLRVAGFQRYEIYDANETKLAAGIVPSSEL